MKTSQAHRAQARVVFVQHDVETDYGDKSDLSRFHNVRAVPCFLFFDGGAVVSVSRYVLFLIVSSHLRVSYNAAQLCLPRSHSIFVMQAQFYIA